MQAQGFEVYAPMRMEHRWGERIALDCPACLDLPDGTRAAGRIRNASISGALIDTEVRLPVNATLDILFGDLELPACVVRTTRDGLAVEWRDMAEPPLIALLRSRC